MPAATLIILMLTFCPEAPDVFISSAAYRQAKHSVASIIGAPEIVSPSGLQTQGSGRENATVFVYRKEGGWSTSLNPWIHLDRKDLIKKLTKNRYFAVEVLPGLHTFTFKRRGADLQEFTFAASPGAEVYIEYQSGSIVHPTPSMELRTPEKARKEMAKLRPEENKNVVDLQRISDRKPLFAQRHETLGQTTPVDIHSSTSVSPFDPNYSGDLDIEPTTSSPVQEIGDPWSKGARAEPLSSNQDILQEHPDQQQKQQLNPSPQERRQQADTSIPNTEASPSIRQDPPSTQQTAAITPRIAVVTRTNGSVLKGKIIKQDENIIKLDSDGVTMSIPIPSVRSVSYEEGVFPEPESAKYQLQLKQALQAMRKLTTATELGISYVDYGRMLIEVKSDVANNLQGVPSGPTAKIELAEAMREFEIAGRVWDRIWNEDFFYLMNMSKEDKAMLESYQVPIRRSLFYKVYYKNDILNAIWQKARFHFYQAQRLIDKDNKP